MKSQRASVCYKLRVLVSSRRGEGGGGELSSALSAMLRN
jgi:hypothetical protein